MAKPLSEVVLYTAQGRTQAALVLSARVGEVSHLGKNGEALLTLAIVKQPAPNAPHKRPTGLQTAVAVPEIEILHDVVHTSHEFDAAFLERNGSTSAQIAAQRGHGEWTELEGDASEVIGRLRSRVIELSADRDAAVLELGKQKARADLADSIVDSLRKELAAPKPAEPTE